MNTYIATNLSQGHDLQDLRLNTMHALANGAELLETKLVGQCNAYEKLRVMLAPVALLRELIVRV